MVAFGSAHAPPWAHDQLAYRVYFHDTHTHVAHANGLLVLTLTGNQISVITRFGNTVLSHLAGHACCCPAERPNRCDEGILEVAGPTTGRVVGW